MHDISLPQLLELPTLASPQPVPSAKRDWQSLASLASEAPYRAPQKLDLERMKLLVSSKRLEAEDHLWSLKEDPAYFTNTLTDWAEHWIEMIRDIKRRSPTGDAETFLSTTTAEVLRNAYEDVLHWQTLESEVDLFATSLARHPDFFEKPHISCADCEESFQIVEYCIKRMIGRPESHLIGGVTASSLMRSCYKWPTADPLPNGLFTLELKKGRNPHEKRVNAMFNTLVRENQ